MSGSWLLGLSRAIPYLLVTFAIMPFQAILLAVSPKSANRFPRIYHGWSTKLLGLNIVSRGERSTAQPTLFVSNHTSYLDIEVLASLVDVSFIAKSEMMNWPFIGWLAKLQRSVFIDRKRTNVGEHKSEVAKRLAAGDNLVLFAEGTTSDGNRLLPFKSPLFAVAAEASPERPLTIQPVSIMATELDGMPLGRWMRSLYSWYGDMPLLPHAWAALKTGRLTIMVEFHAPFTAEGLTRKQLAARCQAEIQAGVTRAICGRFEESMEYRHHGAGQGDNVDAAA